MRRIRFGQTGGSRADVELTAGDQLARATRDAGRRAALLLQRQRRNAPAVAEVLHAGPARLLLVAGVVLDLLVGELVRRAGESPACRSAGVDWVLPDAPITTGVRCVYDPASAVGAAVLWVAGEPDPGLPQPPDLAALLDAAPPLDGAGAARLLRLRFVGWVPDRVVVLRQDGVSREVLSQLAGSLVDRIHRPLYAELGLAASDQRRHLVNRLVLDFTVAELVARGELAAPGADLVRRLVWTGPDWALAADARVAQGTSR